MSQARVLLLGFRFSSRNLNMKLEELGTMSVMDFRDSESLRGIHVAHHPGLYSSLDSPTVCRTIHETG